MMGEGASVTGAVLIKPVTRVSRRVRTMTTSQCAGRNDWAGSLFPVQGRAITAAPGCASVRHDDVPVRADHLLSMIAPAMFAGVQIILGGRGDLVENKKLLGA